MKIPVTIITTLHYYSYDIGKPEDAKAYAELSEMLKAKGLKLFDSISAEHGAFYERKIKPLDNTPITLETSHLFNNQWNTAATRTSESGLRVFDWAEAIMHYNRKIKIGMWLEQNEDMRKVRRVMLKCGYCGAMHHVSEGKQFCDKCLDSEYLQSGDLCLLRLLPIAAPDKRGELTEQEKAKLIPLYKHAQMHGCSERGKKRIADKRISIERDYKQAIAKAEAEHKGFLWLLDHNINIDNVIYYFHTNHFCFGWRKPVDDVIKGELLDVISEFPFAYEIKCEDGKTLEGY